MLGLNQLLTLFLLGVTSSVSNACELTPLQAKTLSNSEPNIPISLQPQAFSLSRGGKNTLDTKVTFDIKTVQTSIPSFSTIDWSTVAPSPLPRVEAQGAVVDGKLYVLGGEIKNSSQLLNTVDVYDPVNNTWMGITNMPEAITHAGTTVDGKDIYLAGGYVGKPTGGRFFATTNVWKYNIDTQTWTALPPLPQARGGGALELLERELHFFGGSDIKRMDKGDHWILSLDDLIKGWTPAAPLPNPRNHLGDAVFGGRLYAIGGQHSQNRYSVTQSSVHMWDLTTNTWTAVAKLPRARSHISGTTFVMDGQIIVAGGEVKHGVGISDVTAYDPLSNSWKELTPLPATRRAGVVGSIENQIFYTTGASTTTYKGVPVLIFPAIVSDSAITLNPQRTLFSPLTN